MSDFLPRSGVEVYAVAEISVLRAHAAQKSNSQCGLEPAVRCAVYEGRLWAVSDAHHFADGGDAAEPLRSAMSPLY